MTRTRRLAVQIIRAGWRRYPRAFWVMAARKFDIANADEMFPENDEPRRKRPAKKLVRTQTAKTGQYH